MIVVVYIGLSIAASVLAAGLYVIIKISRMNFENEPFDIQK